MPVLFYPPHRAGSGGQDPVLITRMRQQVRILSLRWSGTVDTCGCSGTVLWPPQPHKRGDIYKRGDIFIFSVVTGTHYGTKTPPEPHERHMYRFSDMYIVQGLLHPITPISVIRTTVDLGQS